MAPPGGVRPMTIKQAKKAFKKQGGVPKLSEKEQRQLSRTRELESRAEAIRQRERRKKENARKRSEVETRQRETRQRMGITEPVDEGYVSPRQTRMMTFFTKASDQEAQVSRKANVDVGASKALVDGEEVENPQTDRLSSEKRLPAAKKLGEEPNNLPPTAAGWKRNHEQFEGLKRSSSSQPARLALEPTDPNVFVHRKELWIPPSQNTISHKRQKSCDLKLSEPFPELPFPPPPSWDLVSEDERLETASDIHETAVSEPEEHDSAKDEHISPSLIKEEWAIAAQMFSSDPTLDDIIGAPDKQAISESITTPSRVHPPAKTGLSAAEVDMDKLMAEFSSSQFSTMDLPPLPVKNDDPGNGVKSNTKGIASSGFPFSDGLDVSAEEAAQLEQQALLKTRVAETANEEGKLPAEKKQLDDTKPDTPGDRHIGSSFSFGDFDFCSQDLKGIGL